MEEKIYFMPGDVVTIKQYLPNKPLMIVVKKQTTIFKHLKDEDKDSVLIGIKCRWFTKDGALEEAIFNTKDLIKISK